jgi:LysR family glycine cleavage system transcriptional activator
VESSAQALDAALAGAGVALVNVAFATRHVEQGRLRILGPAVDLKEGYYLVYRAENSHRTLIRGTQRNAAIVIIGTYSS